MLLEANEISMSYPKSNRLILDKINISVDKGEFVVVTGDSGSGKSTLLAILGGYLRPVHGVVRFGERNLAELSSRELSRLHRDEIGYVPQSNVMLKKYSVLENIIVPFQMDEKKKNTSDLEEKAHMHLRQLGMEQLCDRYPYELSGGELKRVSLARAMLRNPEIIIADEPTTGLDKNTGINILNYLYAYSQTGKAVIVATHDALVSEYGNKMLVINKSYCE